jgi:hypothetical protein
LDSLEKQGSEISRHPHASVGRGISWKVTGVHPNLSRRSACLLYFYPRLYSPTGVSSKMHVDHRAV